MQISFNDQIEEYPTEGMQCFGELMESLHKQAADHGDAVITIRLNGEDITGQDRSHLEELALDQVETLEVHTGDPRTLAKAALSSIAEFHQQLLSEMRSTAELFRLGDAERSNRSFLACIDGLQVFMHTLESCRKMLGVSFELLTIPSAENQDELTVAEYRRNLFSVLDGLFNAQTDQDWVLLADMLEYELIPALEEWEQIIQLIMVTSDAEQAISEHADVMDAQSELVG
jgi:hypothetical protein